MFRVTLYDNIELITEPDGGLCWQQTIYPLYPPQEIRTIGQEFSFQLCYSDGKLTLRIISEQRTNEKVMIDSENTLDIYSMNNKSLRQFYAEIIENEDFETLVDATNLCLRIPDEAFVWSDAKEYLDTRVEKKANSGFVFNNFGIFNAFEFLDADKKENAILIWPFTKLGSLDSNYFARLVKHFEQIRIAPERINLKACLISSDKLFRRFNLSPNRLDHCGLDLSPMTELTPRFVFEIVEEFVELSESVNLLSFESSEIYVK